MFATTPYASMKAMLPEIRYAKSGDGYVAYQTIGDRPTDLLVLFAYLTHLEHAWSDPNSARFLGRLADIARVTRFDVRGFGLSDPLNGKPDLSERMGEITAVLDAVGIERVALAGLWEGGHMAMQYAFENPERVSSLILYASAARLTAAPDYEFQMDHESAEAALLMLVEHWGDASFDLPYHLLAPSMIDDHVFRKSFAELQRLGCSPGRWLENARWSLDVDVRNILPLITVPTLVLHRKGDLLCPIANGRYVAEHIPGAQLVELDGDDHLPMVGDVEAIADAIEAFLTGRISRRRRASHVVPAALREAGVTRREFEVLDLVASGAANTAIAEELHISVRTVESHISSLFSKLGSDNRAGLIATGVAIRTSA
jgi:pimeloyl-ACP methyl ester carboxylesterase/DNA-binding CsgD family transcriptional regulator